MQAKICFRLLVNPCDSSPCKNGGTCENDADSFSCNCTEKFEGSTCEEKGLQFNSMTLKTHIGLKIFKI